MRQGRKYLLVYLTGALLICSLLILLSRVSSAAASLDIKESQNFSPGPGLPDQNSTGSIVGNDVCLECHGEPGLSITLTNGDILDLYVNPETYSASIHGQNNYACVQCHTDLGNYPHPAFTASDLRDVTLQLTKVCIRCHSGEYNLTLDSVHSAAQAEGMREAAVCTDCHGSHDTRQWTDLKSKILLPSARLDIPLTCSKCHSEIYHKYQGSVHGAALTEESNTDVPTCIDCHGVHNIENPTTNAFRLKSPELCASCHTDPMLMDKYGITTDVLNTYVADFHGTTVTLFEKQSPDAPTNKPVCYDCHGVHDISRIDDPQTGILMQQNLLVRCKVCHPDASSNFPGAWMSHYIPSTSNYALVYYVNLFYKFFIPLVLGGMVALVGMDVGHSVYVRTRRGKPPSQPPSSEAQIDTTIDTPAQSPPLDPEELSSDLPVPPPPLDPDSEEGQHD